MLSKSKPYLCKLKLLLCLLAVNEGILISLDFQILSGLFGENYLSQRPESDISPLGSLPVVTFCLISLASQHQQSSAKLVLSPLPMGLALWIHCTSALILTCTAPFSLASFDRFKILISQNKLFTGNVSSNLV